MTSKFSLAAGRGLGLHNNNSIQQASSEGPGRGEPIEPCTDLRISGWFEGEIV